MTVATEQAPSLSFGATSCNDALFSSLFSVEQAVSISATTGSASFDWSDFPVVHQYNEDMPVPASVSSSSPKCEYFSSPPRRCGLSVRPTMPWDVEVEDEDDDETISFSISSDDETVVSSERSILIKPNKNSNNNKKSVKFAEVVEVHSHAVVLSDHPCCHGLALELGWVEEDSEIIDFEVFESSRHFQRRHMNQLRLSYWERRHRLIQSTGLSEQELLLQEQRAWRDQHFASETQSPASKDKAPSIPSKSCEEQPLSNTNCGLKKVASNKTLSSWSL